jgi:hypothetical protein
VNVFRVGYVGATFDQHSTAADPADISALQLTGVFTNLDDTQRSYPGVSFNGQGTGLAAGGGPVNDSTTSYQPMWDLSNTTTWVKGAHTLNSGFNYRRWSLQRDLATDFLGNFNFDGLATGNAVADMLLGYSQNATVFQPAAFSLPDSAGNQRQFNLQYFAPYVQDDWKVNSDLTLNLGLRWDYRSVPYESNDRMGWRDLSNPRGGLLVADQKLVDQGIVGDSTYYRSAGRRNPKDGSKNVLAPRLGLRTAVRRREDRGPRRLRLLLGLLRRAGNRRSRGHLSVRQPRELHPERHHAGAGDDEFAVPELLQPQCGDPRGEHVPGGQHVAAAAESLCSAVDARRPARDLPEHDRGHHLRRLEGHAPADATKHRAGLAARSQHSAH